MKRNVLLIMPKFFDYPQVICEELERMGYEVDFFDDRPSTSGIIKAIIRVNKNIIGKYISSYFEEIMKTVRSKEYDIVFLISGQSLSFSEEMILQIKEAQPKAKYILYQWDSIKNFPYIRKISPFFDKCYSFDRDDTKKYPELAFLPLFYSRRYETIGEQEHKQYKYDFCFVGTAHPKKYKFIQMMSEKLRNVYPKQFVYYFFPSRLVFFYRKLRNKEFKRARYKEFHFESLSGLELDNVYIESRCVLDSAQEGQTGLTIRVLEAIGAKKKLITTNEDVRNYDFYREENILIFDGEIDEECKFFTEDYVCLPEEIYQKYSLRNWLKVMIGE